MKTRALVGTAAWGSVRAGCGVIALGVLVACGAQVEGQGDGEAPTESLGSVQLALTDYSTTLSTISSGNLYSVDAANGTATQKGAAGVWNSATAFVTDQQNHGYAIQNGTLYQIDLPTGTRFQLGATNWGSAKVLAFGSELGVNKLFSVDTSGHLVAIDLISGAPSDRGPGYAAATTLTYAVGALFTIVGNTLLRIDPHTGAQTRLNSPGEFDSNTLLTSDGAPFHLYAYQPRFGTFLLDPGGADYVLYDTSANLLQQPIAFDNPIWVRNRANIVFNGAIAPDGTTHGEILTENTTTGTHSIQQSFSVLHGRPVTFSVFAKGAGRRYIDVDLISLTNTANAVGVTVDLTTGKILRGVGSGATQYIDSKIAVAGDDWYRVSLTAIPDFDNDSVRAVVYMLTDPNTASYKGNGTNSVNLWGAQLNLAKDIAAQDPISNRWFIDTWPVEHASVGSFDPVVVDPLGRNTAELLKEDTQNSVHRVYQTNLNGTTDRNYTWSIDVKPALTNPRTTVELKLSSPDDSSSYIGARAYIGTGSPSIVGQNIVGQGALVSSELRPLGNGWFRVSVTGRPTSVRSNRLAVELRLVKDVFGSSTYTGDGASGVYVWGPQLQGNLDPTLSSPLKALVETPRDCPIDPAPEPDFQCLDTLFAIRQNGQLSRFVGLDYSGSAYGNEVLGGSTWPATTLLAP